MGKQMSIYADEETLELLNKLDKTVSKSNLFKCAIKNYCDMNTNASLDLSTKTNRELLIEIHDKLFMKTIPV